jgi:hypothetical protein
LRFRLMSCLYAFLSASISNPLQPSDRSMYKVLDRNSPSKPPHSIKKPLVFKQYVKKIVA